MSTDTDGQEQVRRWLARASVDTLVRLLKDTLRKLDAGTTEPPDPKRDCVFISGRDGGPKLPSGTDSTTAHIPQQGKNHPALSEDNRHSSGHKGPR